MSTTKHNTGEMMDIVEQYKQADAARKRHAGKFTVMNVPGDEKPWKVVWNFPDGATEVVSGYSKRQNAYRRCKQLNERNVPPRDLYVRITTERQWCRDIRRVIGKFGQMTVSIIDPLDDTRPERRYVQFGVLCRFHEDSRVGVVPGVGPYEFFDEQPPLERDVLEWLEQLRQELGVLEMETSYHSFLV